MTEQEKCAAGLLHNPVADETMSQERAACKDLCWEYNALRYSDFETRETCIRRILGACGKRVYIEQPFWCDYGYHVTAGDDLYINHNCVILDAAPVTFGSHVLVAPNCGFYTAGHPFDVERRNAALEYARPITVGDNVWIGGNVAVLPGVTIGSGTVVAAGSVVTRSLPGGVLAAGNPCRVVRTLSEADREKYK